MTPPSRAALLALVAALATMLSACAPAADSGHGATGDTWPDQLTVEIMQYRSDVATREAHVLVTNGSDEAITIDTLVVQDPRFQHDAQRAVERASTIPAGVTTGVRVALPPMACPADAPGATQVVISYTENDTPREATAPLPDPLDFLTPLHERECRAAELAHAADVTFERFEPGSPGVLTLSIHPTGDGEAEVTALQPTNLIRFAGQSGPLPLDVQITEGATDITTIDVPIEPTRCDPHAVQEDKRGTIFTLEVNLHGQPGSIELPASDELKGRILTWVPEWCVANAG
ncbi:hypothetical protein [Agromyces silvae]|uniref:hypothetical protein n=1 Tax=Agromyces silvae TaxID=3388266 RepID=UPI00280C2FCB|nr:hypothetical protein [Agromyces protaetiae]